MGDIQLALGHTIAATSAYEESLTLRRSLVESDPSNSRWQDGVSSSLHKISDLERVASERAAKLAVQRVLQDIDRLMFEIDRVSAELQDRLSLGANERNAAVSVPTRVLATIEESLTVSRQLAASNPTNAKHQYDLLADLEELARARIHNGDPVEAFSAYEEGLAIRRCLADTDQNDEQLQRGLCVARALLHAGHRCDERVELRVQLLGALEQGSDDLDRTELAGAELRGEVDGPEVGDVVVHGRSLARRQEIDRTSFPKWLPDSMRSCASAASASGRTLSITGAQVPSSTARSSAAKSRALPIVVPRIENWPK